MKVRVDICNREKISGWAIDEKDRATKVSLDLYVNRKFQGTIFARNKRPDLSLAVTKDGKCGFLYKFSKLVSSKSEMNIDLINPQTNQIVYQNQID